MTRGPILLRLGSATFGLAMGAVLSRAGFADPAEIHAMFTFAEGHLIATFALAVALAALGFRLFVPRAAQPRRRLHPGTIPGGLLLGAGWALCGACPAIVWVQLGEGRLAAGWTLLGVVAGLAIEPVIHRRFLRWPSDACP